MRNREFRGDRLFKIVRLLVNIVAGFTLLFGVFGLFRLESLNLYFLNGFDKCTKEGGTMQTCGFYLDAMSDNEKRTYLFLKIGIGLPILFYGGTAIYNYLFPKKLGEGRIQRR